MKLYATKRTSKKSKKEYVALIFERDGRETFVSFDQDTICNVTNLAPINLYTALIELGQIVIFDIEGDK